MGSCVFCEIINKREDAFIIFETEYVCCFFDKYPINKGHVLVVPKKHAPEFTDVDPKSLSQVILVAQKVAKALETLLKTDGITMMQNNGIFKDVDHYHMHVIPRFVNDGFSWVEPEVKVSREEFTLLRDRLKKAMHL
ncbi:Diadenosine tetraphosphate (Ap4A) hydrolase [Oceanobacillus limi]|uniref:Diadenosine tetraphosphate (Ap4A) hydrolase n=1 Tax=Oceanobacillus limi TaxID=930131 RepID=A0A1H9Y2R1_9BACI|nr:HIT family protein [Oceanobacillus limi]SES63121.1 Diadenosine tetraphosphate (Ap4A) hydrolase [Oceanobacillus limi]